MATAFISYSHKDEHLKDELLVHMAMLKREHLLSTWYDRKIPAGSEFDATIIRELMRADIILLLVSPDFLASRYCYEIEVERALQRHRDEQARVIPVILRPCDWRNAAFAHLLAVPRDGLPVTEWPNRDNAFLDVVRHVRAVLAPRSEPQVPDEPDSEARTSLGDVMGRFVKIREDISLLRDFLRITDPNLEKTLSDADLLKYILGTTEIGPAKRLIGAFEKAGEMVEAIQRSRPAETTERERTTVYDLLGKLKRTLSVPMRAYQERLAQSAIEATISAIRSNNREIGVLYQTVGSGLTMTLAAYVAIAANHPGLRGIPIFVVANMSVLVAQLHDRLCDIKDAIDRPIIAPPGEDLLQRLQEHPNAIFVTTYQSLRRLRGLTSPSGNVLVVESSSVFGSSPPLRNAFRIVFTTDIEARAAGGTKIIGGYSLKESVQDGNRCPVMFERRRDIWRGRLESEAHTRILAEEIVEHFTRLNGAGPAKAILIVYRITTGRKLTAALNEVARTQANRVRPFAAHLTSLDSAVATSRMLQTFAVADKGPRMLVAGTMWPHIDAPVVSCAYVLCKLTASSLWQVPGIICRPYPGKVTATLVDFADNEFPPAGEAPM